MGRGDREPVVGVRGDFWVEERGGERADLFELVLLCCLVFARFGGLAVQLLCCELGLEASVVSGLAFSWHFSQERES